MMEKKYTFDDFIDIVATLRAPDGCPWDQEQTHHSLKPCMMEEAAEVLAAIRILDTTGEPDNLREERGDVLLQVVMHSQIAREEGHFTLEDVIDEVSAKMIRRHPHVFGEQEVSSADHVLRNWDEIKKKEKEGKSIQESPLREIPKEFPALTRLVKILKKIDMLYQKQHTTEEAVVELESQILLLKGETGKVESAGRIETATQTILTKILVEIANIARENKIPLEQLLVDHMETLIEEFEPLTIVE